MSSQSLNSMLPFNAATFVFSTDITPWLQSIKVHASRTIRFIINTYQVIPIKLLGKERKNLSLF